MGGISVAGAQGRAVLKSAAILEQASHPHRMLCLMLTRPITARQQSLTSFIVGTATAAHRTSSMAASLPTRPFSTNP